RIDITNFCSTASNWAVSENIKCGTPGSENSIKGIYEDNIAPVLKSHVLLSNQELQVEFSESINEDAALLLSNYTIESISVSSITKESDQVFRLHFASELQDGEIQKLTMNNLTDECGNSQEISVDFLWHDIHEYDLVINEIFADETPIVGLPEYEFIEIYNTSEFPINIKDYKLKVGGSEKTLSGFEIQAHDYLILCSNAATELYREFGNSLGVSSFPSLTNSGTSISLESSSGVLLDQVTYSSDWYGDDEKKNGGWSLERIDIDNHSWQADNWRASMDESGGTPGKNNSIEGLNPDVIPPRLLSFEMSNSNSIDLFFSETLESNHAFNIQNYLLSRDIGHPTHVVEIENDRFALRLNFKTDFEHNILFQLTLSDLLVDLAGNSIEERELEFSFADMPQEGDLIINEVLFNPYPGGTDYVELLNVSDRMIDVQDLFIANRDEDYQLDAIYQMSEKSKMLEAGAYLLLSADTANVKMNYAHIDESTFLQLKNLPPYNDDEGRVVILNKNNDQLDDFAYDENIHFNLLTSKEGVSLERINPNKETNSYSNWKSAAQSIGFGTPGLKNSSYDVDETVVNVVGFKSRTFSPDNDGVDDRLIINFDLEKSGYVANIRVYNSFGREVRRLASNLTLSTNDELFWDGLLSIKERAPIGIYVFYFELFHPDGDVKTYKRTCVLGGKLK
uniref:lamin tail domain-containing protein n=1 Tax=Ancylomarina sp. TaxID=1970196 RepID=UPI00356908D4